MKTTALVALVVMTIMAAGVAASTLSMQSFVAVGDDAISASMAATPSLEQPVLLEMGAGAEAAAEMEAESETHGDLEAAIAAEIEEAITSPELVAANQRIEADTHTLASMELLAHQLGAPVLSELMVDRAVHEANAIQHSLLATSSKASKMSAAELIDGELPTALLASAPATDDSHMLSAAEAETASFERQLAMVEMGAELEPSKAPRAPLPKQNNYAFLDDPQNGGAPSIMKNLKGLDIYVVNTPISDNEHEIRPVAPPNPMSASMRQRAKQASLVRQQLIHDVPQPQAKVKPTHKINTLSAYEPSLQESKPLPKVSRLISQHLDRPLVGGHGAMQLRGIAKASQARFAQLDMELPGTGADGAAGGLPGFPNREPAAAKKPMTITVGRGSSFDNRDGPPVLLDDLLPLKAQIVEQLDPLHDNLIPVSQEALPNGWGTQPRNIRSPLQ